MHAFRPEKDMLSFNLRTGNGNPDRVLKIRVPELVSTVGCNWGLNIKYRSRRRGLAHLWVGPHRAGRGGAEVSAIAVIADAENKHRRCSTSTTKRNGIGRNNSRNLADQTRLGNHGPFAKLHQTLVSTTNQHAFSRVEVSNPDSEPELNPAM